MALPPLYTKLLLDTVPPWLTRIVGEKYMRSLGERIDALVTRVAQGVRHRFPGDIDESSLGTIGRERRIRRGPEEPPASYARRLRKWWDAHRRRGGPYALLGQLHAYFADLHDLPRIDVVATSGNRHWVAQGVADIDASAAITHDSVDWDPHPSTWDIESNAIVENALAGAMQVRVVGAADFATASVENLIPVRIIQRATGHSIEVDVVGRDGEWLTLSDPLDVTYTAGTGFVEKLHYEWAHVWVFLYVDEAPVAVAALVDHAGNTIVTDEGDEIIVVTDISAGGTLAEEAAEVYRAVPREWSSGHIPYVTVVLFYGLGVLWDYPVPVETWDEPGRVWDEELPVVLIAE